MNIEVENLAFSYLGERILQDVNLSIAQGEFIGIMGPNGGGKTTLLNLLMGFLKPDSGKVYVDGKIGYVPQVHNTDREFPICVEELILLGALSQTNFFESYPHKVKERASHLMNQLGLTRYQNVMFGKLSGGLAQRTLLARALVSDPDILLLDEPTANIDPISTKAIYAMIEELRGKKTILLVTHDLPTIIHRVDRVICVKGKVSSFLPKDVCEHFAMGLYHSPLLEPCTNHFTHEVVNVQRSS